MKNRITWFFVASSFVAGNAMAKDTVQTLETVEVIATLPTKTNALTTPVTVLSEDELRLKVGHSIGEP
jgi:hypothetical protein